MSAPVAVVLAALDIPPRALAGYWESLSHDERARAARFLRETDRARFVAAHGMLRAVLGRAAACTPAALEFARNAFGKPYLVHDGKPHPLRFNLSHGGGLLLIAFGLGREVGVDVERPRALAPDGMDALMTAAFAPVEQSALRALPPRDRARAAYRLWVRREALAKAQGTGLARPSSKPQHGGWTVRDLPLGPGVFAALAAEGEGIEVHIAREGRDGG